MTPKVNWRKHSSWQSSWKPKDHGTARTWTASGTTSSGRFPFYDFFSLFSTTWKAFPSEPFLSGTPKRERIIFFTAFMSQHFKPSAEKSNKTLLFRLLWISICDKFNDSILRDSVPKGFWVSPPINEYSKAKVSCFDFFVLQPKRDNKTDQKYDEWKVSTFLTPNGLH